MAGTTDWCYTGSEGTIVVQQVPADICDQCGYELLTGPVVDRLTRFVQEQPEPVRMMSVPVYHFTRDSDVNAGEGGSEEAHRRAV